jgi:predicted signal transduction protein with EAL and GGDEF domain
MKAVTEPNAATVVRTIVAMSHHLGIKVIAEGVETPEHLRFLAQRKCDEAQGYYFSRPVAASAFVAAVAAIHKLFDERKLLEEIRLASSEGGIDNYETDQELERQGSPSFEPLQKQVVM